VFATDHTGQTLDGKYHLERLLGEGGMGAVYLGRHLLIGKRLAVKFLHAELTGNEEAVKRFYREAQAAAAIGHKNIVDVLDVGVTPAGEPYLVMEYLEGEGLCALLERKGPMDLAAACAVLEPTLIALAAAHDKLVVHRDLKPDNIFLVRQPNEAPTVKLIDFGISKFAGAGDATRLTRDGTTLGTPAYMSPEQARGAADVDHLTDIYAMGVIFYEMLTGGLPFASGSYNELLFEILTGAPRDPAVVRPEFPEEARPVIERAMAREAGARYASARDLLDAVRELVPAQERLDAMIRLGSDMREVVVSGDLGAAVRPDGDTQLAADILTAAVKERRGVGGVQRAREALLIGPRRRLYRVAAGAALLLIMGLLVMGLCGGPAPVRIEIAGVPAGATIYYEDSPVPVNPFLVDHRETLVPIRVEAKGYADYRISIVPSEDRRIEAVLTPLAGKAPAKERKGPVPPPAAEPPPAPEAPSSLIEQDPPPAPAQGTSKSGKRKSKSKNPFKKIKLPWK